MMKNLLLTLATSCLLVFNSYSQIEKMIPKSAGLVIGINAKELKGKLDTSAFNQLPLYQKLKERSGKEDARRFLDFVYPFLVSSDSLGLSMDENWYFVIDLTEVYFSFSFLIPLADTEKGMKVINGIKNKGESKINSGKNYQFYNKNRQEIVAWNDKYILISNIDLKDKANGRYRGFEDGMNVSQKKYNERLIRDSLKTVTQLVLMETAFSEKKKTSLLNDKYFKSKLKENHDVFVWFSSEKILAPSLIDALDEELKWYRNQKPFFKNNIESIQPKYAFVSLDFKDNQLTSNIELTADKDFIDDWRKLQKNPINPVLGKYINKEKASVVGGLSFDSKEVLPLLEKLYFSGLSERSRGRGFGQDMGEVLNVLMSQPADSLQVWDGDIAFAFEGFANQQITYLKQNYNENYVSTSMTHVIDTIDQPQFVIVLTTEDTTHLHDLVNIFRTKVPLTDEHEDYYEFSNTRALFYVAIHNKTLIITTVKDRVTRFKNGLPDTLQYQFDDVSNVNAKLDLQQLMTWFLDESSRYYSYEDAIAQTIIDYTSNLELTGVTFGKTSVSAVVDLNLIENPNNSFTSFIMSFDKMGEHYKEGKEAYQLEREAEREEGVEDVAYPIESCEDCNESVPGTEVIDSK